MILLQTPLSTYPEFEKQFVSEIQVVKERAKDGKHERQFELREPVQLAQGLWHSIKKE